MKFTRSGKLHNSLGFLPKSAVISGPWPWFMMIWGEWFLMFLWSYHRKIHCGRNRIDHGGPCKNGVHPREFVFLRNHLLLLMISGIQTHEDELRSAWVLMMDSLYHTLGEKYTCIFFILSHVPIYSFDNNCFIHLLKSSIHSWNTAISKFCLKNPRLRSWVDLKVKVLLWVQHHIEWYHFCSVPIGQPIPKIWLFQDLTLKN